MPRMSGHRVLLRVQQLLVSTLRKCPALSICPASADAVLSFHYRHRYFSFFMNRDQLQNDYIESIIDGMDHKSMYQFVYDTMEQNLETYSDEELVTEVKDYYPELLEPTISELEATASDYGVGK